MNVALEDYFNEIPLQQKFYWEVEEDRIQGYYQDEYDQETYPYLSNETTEQMRLSQE
jgi:hypothetical protein